MVELQVGSKEDSSQVPTALLITFTACTTLLVSVHMVALMISTCILPNVEAVAAINGLIAVCVFRFTCSLLGLTVCPFQGS